MHASRARELTRARDLTTQQPLGAAAEAKAGEGEKKPDLNIVLVNKVQTCTASWPAVHMTAGSYNLSASQGLAGSVRGVI